MPTLSYASANNLQCRNMYIVVPKKNADEYEEYMQFVLSARVWEVIAKRASAFIAYADRDGAEKAAAEVPESL